MDNSSKRCKCNLKKYNLEKILQKNVEYGKMKLIKCF